MTYGGRESKAEYGGPLDFKRSKQLGDEEEFLRGQSLDKPSDFSRFLRRDDWFYDLINISALIFRLNVVLPTLIICSAGGLMLLAEANSPVRDAAIGVIAGGAATGVFSWVQAIGGERSARAKLRRDIGMSNDLGYADFSGTQVAAAYFRNRRLCGAKFSRAKFARADFTGADLTDARLTAGNFRNSVFDGACMVGAGLYGAILSGCSFRSCQLVRASLVNADLRHSDLRGANLKGADLRGADLRFAVLYDPGRGVESGSAQSVQFEDTWYDNTTKWPTGFIIIDGAMGLVNQPESAREVPKGGQLSVEEKERGATKVEQEAAKGQGEAAHS